MAVADKAGVASQKQTVVTYASQSGTALHYASQLAENIEAPVTLLSLDRIDDDLLENAACVIFVVSTYGEGEPPDNGVRFSKKYLTASAQQLSHLKFAVFALGDRSYQYFCGFGHSVYRGLKHHGATPLFPVIELDAQSGEENALELSRGYEQLRTNGINVKPAASEVEPSQASPNDSGYHRWKLIERTEVNPGSPGESLYWIKLQSDASVQEHWQAGDIAEVIPHYPEEGHQVATKKSAPAFREYSIASIPDEGSLELLVRQQRNPDGSFGLASGWLTHYLKPGGDVELRIRSNPLFKTPTEDTPLILIGNGSGFAGLRSILREREKLGLHKNWLFFGERSPEKDRIFKNEIDQWHVSGHLKNVDLTFSRCPDNPRYVQDALLAADQLVAWIEKGAIVMVCGSLRGMAEGVDQALIKVLGEEQLESLRLAGRYRRDVY